MGALKVPQRYYHSLRVFYVYYWWVGWVYFIHSMYKPKAVLSWISFDTSGFSNHVERHGRIANLCQFLNAFAWWVSGAPYYRNTIYIVAIHNFVLYFIYNIT